MKRFKAEWRALRKKLKSLDYSLRYKVIHTQDQGIPHSRPRAYLVGARRDMQARKFRFPDAIIAEPIGGFLDYGLTCLDWAQVLKTKNVHVVIHHA